MSDYAYCPFCGDELELFDIELHTQNRIWRPCKTNRCQAKRMKIKMDAQGFVLDPPTIRNRYLLRRSYRDMNIRY